jgi:hypothetical protein
MSPLAPDAIRAAITTLADRFGDGDAARLLLSFVSVPFRVPPHAAHLFGDRVVNGTPAHVIAPSALACVCRVTHLLGASITLSHRYWELCADRYCASTAPIPSESDVLVLAREAIGQHANEAAYPLTTLGLQQRGPATGWFLFLRAQAIDMRDVARTLELNRAAWHLAREHRDADLLRAMEGAGASPDSQSGLLSPFLSPGDETPLDIPGLVDRERTLTAYPTDHPAFDPVMRGDRAHGPPGFFLDEFFDEEDDFDDDMEDFPSVVPSSAAVDGMSDAELRRCYPSLPVKPLREVLRIFSEIDATHGANADFDALVRRNPGIGVRLMSGVIDLASRTGRTPETILDMLVQGAARHSRRY